MNPHVLYMFALALLTLMAFGAFIVTPQARLLVDPWEASWRSLGYGRKEIAAGQELNEAQWRRQFAAEDGQHVSAYRMALAPPEVTREWLRRVCPAFGLRTFAERDQLIAAAESIVQSNQELVDANRALLKSIGFERDWRRQLKAALSADERKEIA